MADFFGMNVKLVLKDPANSVIYGEVKDVVPGQALTLLNATFMSTGVKHARYTVPGSQIADLQVVAGVPTPQASTFPTLPQTRHNGIPPQQQQNQTPSASSNRSRPAAAPSNSPKFVDPAIVSFGKSPMPAARSKSPPKQSTSPAQPIVSILPRVNHTAHETSSTPQQQTRLGGDASAQPTRAKSPPKLSITSPGHGMPEHVQGGADGDLGAGQTNAAMKKKTRRGQKKKAAPDTIHDPPPVVNVDVSRNGNDMESVVTRGTGWRQTPLLQPLSQCSAQIEKPNAKKRSQRGRDHQQNGWATEDATDIQDLGDFDFEANHKKFDKREVFNRIREADTTADEDRLVSHNKVHRPGTYGGKNLHPTENVLSPQLGPKHTKHELDSSSDADTELNGRSPSMHSISRVTAMKQPSRQGSTHLDTKGHGQLPLNLVDRGLGLSHSTASLSGRGARDVSSVATPSPRPDGVYSPQTPLIAQSLEHTPIASRAVKEPCLAVASTLLPCPMLYPGALETLESETSSRIGLSQDAMTETAARCITETALSIIETRSKSRLALHGNSAEAEQHPVVVILAGSHTTGARAVAAARHLASRKIKLILAEAYAEPPEERDAQVDTQTTMIRRLVRSGAAVQRGSWRKASQYIKNLAGPPALIIDALLSGAFYSSDDPRAATLREMIEWSNRSRALVLSLGCPSGISGTDGIAPIVDGEPLAVRADTVLGFGAPLRGVLFAMSNGERWREVLLSDIGINIALRADENVPFSNAWIVQLKLLGGESAIAAGE